MSSISRATEWDTGDTLTAAALNAEFSVIFDDFNGGISNTNLAANAAVAWSKIAKTGSEVDDIANVTITSAAEDEVLTWNGSAWVNSAAQGGVARIERFIHGNAVAGTGKAPRFYNRTGSTLTVANVYLYAATAPTGSALTVDVNIDGTTMFTTQSGRPSISASGTNDTSDTPDVTSVEDGSYLDFDCDAIGSTVAGADVLITVSFS